MFENLLDGTAVQALSAGAGLIFAAIKTVQFVQEGSQGLKLRFGKVVRNGDGTPKVIDPGWVWMIPFADKLQRRHVRQQEVTLDKQVIVLKSGLTFNVAGVLYFRVNDVYKALFEIENLDDSIRQLAMGVLRDEIAKHNDNNDLVDTAKISADIFAEIKKRTDEWGVLLIDFRLTAVGPTPESAPIVNMDAAATKRISILKRVATELAVTVDDLVRSGMAAVLVGAPLVASAVVSGEGLSSSVSNTAKDEDDE